MQAIKNRKMSLKKLTETELHTTNEKETSFGPKLLRKLTFSSKTNEGEKMSTKELENYTKMTEIRNAKNLANSRAMIYYR